MKRKLFSALAFAVISALAFLGSVRLSSATNPNSDFFEKNVETLRGEDGQVDCIPAPECYCRGSLTDHSEVIILDFRQKKTDEEEPEGEGDE